MSSDYEVKNGTVKVYRSEKGFGFITQSDGSEIFFHRTDYKSDINHCYANISVEYKTKVTPKGSQAIEIISLEKPGAVIQSAPTQEIDRRPENNIATQSRVKEERTPEQQELLKIMRNKSVKPGRKLTTWSRIIIDDIKIYKKDKETGENIYIENSETGDKFPEVDHIIGSHIPPLASLALDEVWHFKYDEDKFSILKNYIKFTFVRLAREGKVTFNNNYATFNTGLVDNLYEPIYGLFRRNKSDARPYEFVDWCVAGRDSSGKQLIKEFSERPDAASYFSQIGDVIFNDSHNLTAQWDHVLEDAITRGRFPTNFLKEYAPKGFEWDDAANREHLLKEYAEALAADAQARRQIKRRMDDAIQLARKRASWNYKTAIPSYYPAQNRMSILLPLALTDDNIVDLALVVERVNEREYYGATVYPLDMAYKGARLICRPDSDWLRPDTAEEAAAIDDDDDPTE